MLLLISEASLMCVTLGVTATTTTLKHPVGVLLSSSIMVLIVTGEIPGPKFHCGATRLTPMPWTMYCVPLPYVSRKFLILGN